MQCLRIRILCTRSVSAVACRGPTLQRRFSRQRIPVQSLQDKASKWSGVATVDAIDNVNLFEKLGGTTQPFIDLYTNFYNRVYEDEEEWFREIFAGFKKDEAIQNQYEFVVQRMGGPPLFSQRKGHPALIARHRHFPVTHQAAERWLHHMQQALDTTASIDADSKTKMMNFFRHTAYFLVAGNEMTRQQNQGVTCKHATSNPPHQAARLGWNRGTGQRGSLQGICSSVQGSTDAKGHCRAQGGHTPGK